MKKVLFRIISILNKMFILCQQSRVKLSRNSFFKVKISCKGTNLCSFMYSTIEKSVISLRGDNNIFDTDHAFISGSLISIEGRNNLIKLGNNVKLRNANVIIRGNGCSIEIGNETTFGGIRIINVGTQNSIRIGERCLFSDNIELWASDTHMIRDSEGAWINKEKPVIIGDDVWIGSRVIILKGVTIGDGSIIGMGAMVTKNVPPKVITVGSPCRVVQSEIKWELKYPIE